MYFPTVFPFTLQHQTYIDYLVSSSAMLKPTDAILKNFVYS